MYHRGGRRRDYEPGGDKGEQRKERGGARSAALVSHTYRGIPFYRGFL